MQKGVRCSWIWALLALLVTACSVTRNVRPVGAGKAAAGISLGGPFFTNLGPPIPIPLIVLYGRYGITDRLDVDLGLHMPTVRAIGLDVGAAYLVLDQDGGIPAVMLGGRLALHGNGRAGQIDPNTGLRYGLEPHLFEEIYGTASWLVAPEWLLYSGLSAFAEIEHGMVRPSLYGGANWRITPYVGLSAELKWLAFATDQSHLAVNWKGIGGVGAWALQLGALYTFNAGGPL